MARQFNSKNSSVRKEPRIVYESVTDVMTHLASLDGSNPPADGYFVTFLPTRTAGNYSGTDEPEELMEMHGDESIDNEGVASGEYTPREPDDIERDSDALPDNAPIDPEAAQDLEEQSQLDYLENTDTGYNETDPDISAHMERCKTCGGDSVHNEPGNEFYFDDHCPSQGPDCNCGDDSDNKEPHCSGCNDPKCKGKEKYEWQLVDKNGKKITDVCPDCGNTGFTPIGHSYGEDLETESNPSGATTSAIETRVPERVEEAPETSVVVNPDVNSFEDEDSEAAPEEKLPAVIPEPGKPVKVPIGSFEEALKLREQLRNAEEQRRAVSGGTGVATVTHNRCGCSSRRGNMTEEQFRTVLQTAEAKRAIEDVKSKFSNDNIDPELVRNSGKVAPVIRQEEIGKKLAELKRCRGDEEMESLGRGEGVN